MAKASDPPINGTCVTSYAGVTCNVQPIMCTVVELISININAIIDCTINGISHDRQGNIANTISGAPYLVGPKSRSGKQSGSMSVIGSLEALPRCLLSWHWFWFYWVLNWSSLSRSWSWSCSHCLGFMPRDQDRSRQLLKSATDSPVTQLAKYLMIIDQTWWLWPRWITAIRFS